MKWRRKPPTGPSEPGQLEATLVETKHGDYSAQPLIADAYCIKFLYLKII